MDSVVCVSPDTWKGKDLLKIPYELYQPCLSPSPDLESWQGQLLGPAQRAALRPPESHSGEEHDQSECEPKPKPRPANLRRALVTVIIGGVLSGILCLMMLVATIYGCTYAAIAAHYRETPLAQPLEPAKMEGKEVLDSPPA